METPPSRRTFLAAASAALASIPVLGGVWVATRAALAPSGSHRPDRLPLCRVEEVPDDDVLVRAITYRMRRGPAVETVSKVVFVTRDPADPQTILAMSGECTHLSCPVQKKPLEKTEDPGAGPLRCPCHGGVFSRTGEVLAGPPRRPLRRLRIEVPEGGSGTIELLDT